jgi:hypothetical protein
MFSLAERSFLYCSAYGRPDAARGSMTRTVPLTIGAPVAACVVLTAFILVGHAQSPNIVIRGRVAAADTGDPLPRARVVIYNDARPLPPIFTDAEGRFATRLTPGRYWLSVTKAGYALTTFDPLDLSAPDGNDIHMAHGAAISGRVVDRFGEPAAGVIMSLLGPPSADRTKAGAIVKRVTTNDLGEYHFGRLAEGTYYVTAATRQLYNTAQLNRFNESILYYPGRVAKTEAQGIAVRPGDDTNGIDFLGIGS